MHCFVWRGVRGYLNILLFLESSGCYCKILEVKIKIGGKKVSRATHHIMFSDSGSKSVDTGAVN